MEAVQPARRDSTLAFACKMAIAFLVAGIFAIFWYGAIAWGVIWVVGKLLGLFA